MPCKCPKYLLINRKGGGDEGRERQRQRQELLTLWGKPRKKLQRAAREVAS